MKTIIVKIEVLTEKIQDFIDATVESQTATTKEPRCLSYEILQDEKENHKFTLVETYKNDEAIEDHKKTPHFLKWRETVQDMMLIQRTSSKYNYIDWKNATVNSL